MVDGDTSSSNSSSDASHAGRSGRSGVPLEHALMALMMLPAERNLGPKHALAAQLLYMNDRSRKRTSIRMLQERLNVSERTVRRVVSDLRDAQLVNSTRGVSDISGLRGWVLKKVKAEGIPS